MYSTKKISPKTSTSYWLLSFVVVVVVVGFCLLLLSLSLSLSLSLWILNAEYRHQCIFNILNSYANVGAKRNSVVERPLMVRWVVGSILHGGPIEFVSRSIQCSTTGITKIVACALLSVGWCC